MHIKNAIINSFLDKLCKSTLTHEKLEEILKEITNNELCRRIKMEMYDS